MPRRVLSVLLQALAFLAALAAAPHLGGLWGALFPEV